MKILLTGCLCLLLACQERPSGQTSPAKNADTINAAAAVTKTPDTTSLGGTWFLQAALASDTAAGKIPVLQFDLKKSHFSGNTGCNGIHGEFWYSDKDSSLSFSDKLVTTKMACTGYDEKAFVKSLMHATHYRLKNGLLILLAEDNSELSHWARKPATPSNTLKA